MQCPECLASILVPDSAPEEAEALKLEEFVRAGASGQQGGASPPQAKSVSQGQESAAVAASTAGAEAGEQPKLPGERAGPAETEPERTLFREDVRIDCRSVPLAISDRRVQAGPDLELPVERICGVRLIVTAERDLVCGELLYIGEDDRLHRVELAVHRLLRSRLRRLALQLADALRRVLPKSAHLQLLDQAADAAEPFWPG